MEEGRVHFVGGFSGTLVAECSSALFLEVARGVIIEVPRSRVRGDAIAAPARVSVTLDQQVLETLFIIRKEEEQK